MGFLVLNRLFTKKKKKKVNKNNLFSLQPTRHKSNNEWAAAPNSRMAKGSAASPGHLMTEEGEGPAGGCPVRVKELPPGEEARLVTLGFKGYTGLVRTQPGGMLMKARWV